ncbi:MAG: PHP domain-containing protein [Candidatus Limnocylindrales bacterium]
MSGAPTLIWHPGISSLRSTPIRARAASPAWWSMDGHVHSTFSDGVGTLAENVASALAAGLTGLTLVEHVRATTAWLPDLARGVAVVRESTAAQGASIDIRCGVEAKVLDRAGHLDLPPRLEGVDVVLIADHRFPGPDGPLDPAVVARWLRDGTVDARSVLEMLVGALIEAVGRSPLPAVIAHPLSIVPKLGLDPAQVPEEWLGALAARCRTTGTAVEVNEKWACPTPAVARLFHEAGVRLVAGSDAHDASTIGRWAHVERTLAPLLGGAPDPRDQATTGREAPLVT